MYNINVLQDTTKYSYNKNLLRNNSQNISEIKHDRYQNLGGMGSS